MSERPIDDAEPPLPAAALDSMRVPSPPAGFAETVVRAATARTVPPRARGWRAAALIAAALGGAAALAVAGSHTVTRGEVESVARRSLELDERTVAVMEEGARLRWSTDGSEVVVEQDLGRVFYRVDPGDEVTVATPAGRVVVTGTCFDVEVSMPTIGQHAGLAVATAVLVVTVYEGSVLVANAYGERRGAVGQSVVARVGEAPRELEVGAARAALALGHVRHEVEDRRLRVQELQRRVVTAREQRDAVAADETHQQRAERCVQSGGSECEWVEPSPELLGRLADCGLAWVDHPAARHGLTEPPPEFVAAAALSPDEVLELVAINEAYRELDERAHRDFFLALGGTPDLAAKLTLGGIRRWLDGAVDPDRRSEIVREVAEERAGRRERAADVPDPAAQYVRFLLDDGDRYEARVAERLGEARARDLRLTWGSWPGSHALLGEGCEGG